MRRILSLCLIAAMLCFLTGCGCQHEWQEADCLNPKTCIKCGKTEGEALGHDWKEADCFNPRTCTRCGETEGEALGHKPGAPESVAQDLIHATNTVKTVCTVCGEVISEETETMETLYEDGKFLLNGSEFCQRFDLIYRGIGDNIWYTQRGALGDADVCFIMQDDSNQQPIMCAAMLFSNENGEVILKDQMDTGNVAEITCMCIPQVRGAAREDMILGILRTCDPALDDETVISCFDEINRQIQRNHSPEFELHHDGLILKSQPGKDPHSVDFVLTLEK